MRFAYLVILALSCGCVSPQQPQWSNYSRVLQEGETVLVGRIEYLRDWCQVGDKMACYVIRLQDGERHPIIFEPTAPNKVFSGEYDVTGHYVPTTDSRFAQAFSVRLWSLVK